MNLIPERFKELPHQCAISGEHRQLRRERDRGFSQLRPLLAPPGHRGREQPSHRDAQVRVGGIKPVIHVLLGLPGVLAPAHQRHRVDL